MGIKRAIERTSERRMPRSPKSLIALACVLNLSNGAGAELTLSEGTNISVDVAVDGRLVFDLADGIWVLPPGGGEAIAVDKGTHAAARPRWSPAADRIVYQARSVGIEQLFLLDPDARTARRISRGGFSDQHPAWHPDGARVAFASDRRTSGFDIWETDLATGLAWRLTGLSGDETEPVWSADGRNLVYVHRHDGEWKLMLRQFGKPDRPLISASERLSAPSWRPDGSLVTYLRQRGDSVTVDMVILSDPPLTRVLIDDGDIFLRPVAWRDRQSLYYTANGVIRTRVFNAWTSHTLPFRATIQTVADPARHTAVRRRLDVVAAPEGERIIRAPRLFDGLSAAYRPDVDIVINGGRITALEARRERPGAVVVDVGDITVMPGLIDAYAALPEDIPAAIGPLLLSFGLTTLAVDGSDVAGLNAVWASGKLPGPRLVSESWRDDFDSGGAVLLGNETRPASPAGRRYADVRLTNGRAPLTLFSGIADSQTDGLAELLTSRQARLLPMISQAPRRFGETPDASAVASSIVLGSKPSGLPPGIGLHAELRALSAAGLTPRQALVAAGANAARALGLNLEIGRVAVGAAADLILVDGDPLTNVDDTIKVVGVVRNGRFFSTVGLIDIARSTGIVE